MVFGMNLNESLSTMGRWLAMRRRLASRPPLIPPESYAYFLSPLASVSLLIQTYKAKQIVKVVNKNSIRVLWTN